MVAKINRGVSLYGALVYNQRKVSASTARILGGNRLIADFQDNPERCLQSAMRSFENYLLANHNTEKPILHISLNPAPEDRLTDSQFADLARDYMERMGYADQPYIVYLHEDTGRRHVHIVSTCVDERGCKLSDAYEWRRSMQACRELESKYGMQNVADKRRELSEAYLRKADYKEGNLKQQVSNILKSVFTAYRFQSFGEYSALLLCFNVEVKQVKGTHDGVPYTGIVYAVTNDAGVVRSVPIKSSLLGKRFGAEGLARRMAANARVFRAGKWQPHIGDRVALAMHACRGSRERFQRLLSEQRIDTVFRQSAEGRIYGVTFIDHNARAVFNGSRLGKGFSANAFETLFRQRPEAEHLAPPFDRWPQGLSLFDMQAAVEQAFGVFSFAPPQPLPEEEPVRRLPKRKKKKKGRKLYP